MRSAFVPFRAVCHTATLLLLILSTPPALAVMEEVIVSAQKRDQNQQDVPVAVTAFSGKALDQANVKDIFDLQTIAPGLRIGQNQQASTANFNIRGVGTSSSNFGLESSVGLYVDGVYRSRQSAIINNLVDIEAIEVLRGPQGTLFGKNTPSGAILIKTKSATHEQEGFVELNVGNYGLVNLSGAYSNSIVDDVLAFRVGGFSGNRDGFVGDLFLGEDVLNDRDRFGGQVQFLYTPNDDIEVKVIGDYSEIDEVCCAAITLVDSLFANARTGPGGTPIPGTDSLVRALGGTTTTSAEFDDYNQALSHLPIAMNEDKGLSVEINWELGGLTFTSISAWRQFETSEDVDVDFSNLDLFNRADIAEQESFSQEFRIANDADNRLRYVGGLYYFTQDLNNDTTTSTGSASNTYFTSNPDYQATVQPLVDAITFASMLTAGTPFAVPAPVVPFSPDAFAFNEMEQEQESWAVFGQLEFDITDSLMLTFGLRFTDEEKALTGIFTQTANGPPPNPDAAIQQLTILQGATVGDPANGIPPNPALFALFDPSVFQAFASKDWGYYLPQLAIVGPRPNLDESLSDEQLTSTIKLAWRASENILTYISYGTGYKSGGTNTDRINRAFNPVFDAETSDSLEIGFKADFPDQNVRLNVALHTTGVDDFQSNAFQGAGFNLQNAGELDTYGGEIELWWNPTDNTNITAAYVKSVADFESFESANCYLAFPFHTGLADPGQVNPTDAFCDRSGDRVPLNPEDFFVFTATQFFNLSDSVTGLARAEWSYTGDQMSDANNDPLKAQDSYNLLNLSLGLVLEQWNTELTLWGRNVTDERFHNTTFDVPLQDGKINAYPGEPVTFGLKVRTTF